jgi:hypothetical protein
LRHPARQAEAGFGVGFDWDIDLVAGYQSFCATSRRAEPRPLCRISIRGIGNQLAARRFAAVTLHHGI